jgi:glutamate transport system ATP-binding protein
MNITVGASGPPNAAGAEFESYPNAALAVGGADPDDKRIVFDGVNKHFGDLHVLKDINLTVRGGEVVAVIGPSGSGKSTLCRTVNGLERIDSGTIRIDGNPIPLEGADLAKLRMKVGMVFQQFNLFPNKTALENVTFALVKVRGLTKQEARDRAMRLLERVGVERNCNQLPASLSGGQQQRVAIARALAMEPSLMLFDEATSALDPEIVRGVLGIMRDLAENGMTMLVVTHEMGFARATADRIVFMDNGQILEDAPPEQFFEAPRCARAQKFLADVLGR